MCFVLDNPGAGDGEWWQLGKGMGGLPSRGKSLPFFSKVISKLGYGLS